jgi:predicted RNA polymerase sigma factor
LSFDWNWQEGGRLEHQEIIPHLFRTEYRKISSVLCNHFGFDKLGIIEDIASDTFLSALETWPYRGIPENPSAWLYAVAKNKARNYFKHENIFTQKVVPGLKHTFAGADEIDWSDKNSTDSQLQMLFALCNPVISTEAQIGLSLRYLCGFGIAEIADAFLSKEETINKRLVRAREKLRTEKTVFDFPDDDAISTRLDAVLTTLYLFFNEGYYSESNESVVREELCMEAMRLTYLLLENPGTNQPKVNALLALMCFHASRLKARNQEPGVIILYQDQDISLWNMELIVKGVEFLHRASVGSALSKYHIEAGIAYWHTRKEETREKWENILQLYDKLLSFEYTTIAAMNRLFALSKTRGKEVAIREAAELKGEENQYYFSLLAELYRGIDNSKSREYLQNALSKAKTRADQLLIQKKLIHL